MSKNKIMLDLESMGVRASSAIIAIGAVRFNEDETEDEFYEVIDLESCIKHGLTMDASTVMWWMQQSDNARKQFKCIAPGLEEVLLRFCEWVHRGDDDLEMWGNGAAFGNVILSNAYAQTGIEQPWKFRGDRCYRTLKNMYPEIMIERHGISHHALDDARNQANHLIQILKYMRQHD